MSMGGGRFGGGRMAGRAAPVEQTKDFSGTARRMLGRLRPEMFKLVISLLMGVVSVAFMVTGPKILGNATNVLFNGIVSKQLPAGVTQQQAEAMLRLHGQSQIADMISGMSLTPGVGVDLNQLGRVLALAAAVYLLGAVFNFGQGFILAGITQRTMYGLRRQVEQKLARLPLRYFDSHPHGDILSRVSNDIDNLTTTLQQGLSQLLTSVLTIVGVLAMMIWISPLLAGVALITIPLAILITFLIGPMGAHRHVERACRGDPHRTRAGTGLRPATGHHRRVRTPEPAPV
jgi:ATP-binding cassette, subfamily B, multidrug efflux pump